MSTKYSSSKLINNINKIIQHEMGKTDKRRIIVTVLQVWKMKPDSFKLILNHKIPKYKFKGSLKVIHEFKMMNKHHENVFKMN